jgi:hypothetical protein
MQGIDDVARQFIQLFEAEGVPYALMGGLAVRIHALPRATFDVDFTALVDRSQLPRLYQHVESLGHVVSQAQRGGWLDTVRGLPVVKFQVWGGESAIDVDVFLAETDFQREVLKRRQLQHGEDFAAWFVTAEDLILLKLLAARPKDLVDVNDVLFIQGTLDEDYLRRWARQLDIEPALDDAFRRQRESL